MAQFHDLEVTAIRHTIRDAVEVTLRPKGGDFTFVPGQYLTFRRDFDGDELRRSYSICSGGDDGVLQVGIKRVDGGAFSSFANTDLRLGDVLQAMAPQGRFRAKEATGPRHLLAFAGGSGITPILSILRTVLAREPDTRFTLVYANRAAATIMFREELEDLKNRHMGRFNVIHILETEQDIPLFEGRVDGAKCAALFRTWIDIDSVDQALICGPEPMMLAIRAALLDHGMDKDRITYELFGSGQPGRAKQRAAARAGGATGAELTITLEGTSRTIQMEPGQTILEAGLANDLAVPYACTAGVCSTCMCRVTAGEVEMARNHALEDYEVEKGYVLSCQSTPLTGAVSVVYEDH